MLLRATRVHAPVLFHDPDTRVGDPARTADLEAANGAVSTENSNINYRRRHQDRVTPSPDLASSEWSPSAQVFKAGTAMGSHVGMANLPKASSNQKKSLVRLL